MASHGGRPHPPPPNWRRGEASPSPRRRHRDRYHDHYRGHAWGRDHGRGLDRDRSRGRSPSPPRRASRRERSRGRDPPPYRRRSRSRSFSPSMSPSRSPHPRGNRRAEGRPDDPPMRPSPHAGAADRAGGRGLYATGDAETAHTPSRDRATKRPLSDEVCNGRCAPCGGWQPLPPAGDPHPSPRRRAASRVPL